MYCTTKMLVLPFRRGSGTSCNPNVSSSSFFSKFPIIISRLCVCVLLLDGLHTLNPEDEGEECGLQTPQFGAKQKEADLYSRPNGTSLSLLRISCYLHSRSHVINLFHNSSTSDIYITHMLQEKPLFHMKYFSLCYLLRILSEGEIQSRWLHNFIISSTSCLDSSLMFRIYNNERKYNQRIK